MPKKTGIKTKVSSYGRSLSLIMTADRFAALASHLPEDSEERLAIETMVAQAKETKALDELKAKLNQPLSRETLTRFGWNMLDEEGEKKQRVTAGGREDPRCARGVAGRGVLREAFRVDARRATSDAGRSGTGGSKPARFLEEGYPRDLGPSGHRSR